jgi:[ribosomal protein S18]-alanine N-acetyltransferase
MVRPGPGQRQEGKGLLDGFISTKSRPACGKRGLAQITTMKFCATHLKAAAGPAAWSGALHCSRYNGGVPFTLRNFQPEDFDALWRIDQDCFPPDISYSRQELKLYLRRSGAFTLVATEGEALDGSNGKNEGARHGGLSSAATSGSSPVAGFIVAEAGPRRSGHIITIDVVAAARRSGVGSLLLDAAEDRLRAAGCHSVALETAVDNISALSFYKRHGYSVIRTFPRYYSNGVDALVLQKEFVSTV